MLHRLTGRRLTAPESDDGDTLIEVILAVGIVAVTAVALIGTILTSITSSTEHRTLTQSDTVLKSYADAAQQQIQRKNNPKFQPCASAYDVNAPSGIPSTYTVGISSIKYWTGSGWSGGCSGDPVQLITVTVTPPTQISTSLSFAVRDPSDLVGS
jgi:type II secretory pathway pseudopilin PulG